MNTKEAVVNFLMFLENTDLSPCVVGGGQKIIDDNLGNGDVDILIRPTKVNELYALVSKFCNIHKLSLVQCYEHDFNALNFILFNKLNGELVNIDLYTSLTYGQVDFSRELYRCRQNREPLDEFFVLPKSVELVYSLVKYHTKGSTSAEKLKELLQLYNSSSLDSRKMITKYFNKNASNLIESFENKDLSLLNNEIYSKSTSINKSLFFISKRFICNLPRLVKRVLKPTGITVAFLGPDGSGKSTIISALSESRLPFRRIEYYHLKPLLRKGQYIVNNEPHKSKPYNKFTSYLKVLYFFIIYNYGWIINIYPNKMRSSLIIFDRYYYDILVDTVRYRYSGSRFFTIFFSKIIPKPDITFVLTTEADILYSRKPEIEIEKLHGLVTDYDKLCLEFGFIHLDVSLMPQEVCKKVVDLLMSTMNDRY